MVAGLGKSDGFGIAGRELLHLLVLLLLVGEEVRDLLLLGDRGQNVLAVVANVGEGGSSHGLEVVLARILLLLVPVVGDVLRLVVGEFRGQVLVVLVLVLRDVAVAVEVREEGTARAVVVGVLDIVDWLRACPTIWIFGVDDNSIVVVVILVEEGAVDEALLEGIVHVHERGLVGGRGTRSRRVGVRGVAVKVQGVHYSVQGTWAAFFLCPASALVFSTRPHFQIQAGASEIGSPENLPIPMEFAGRPP